MHTKIKEVLDLAVANKASDIHFSASIRPRMRVNGELVDISNFDVEDPVVMTKIILSVLTEEQVKKFEIDRELDCSLTSGEARFRVNMFYQKTEVACALRVVPSEIPGFKELNLPDIFSDFVDYKQGFVLVTGPTGHGKSTTVAATLNEINRRRNCHIVTIEDPVEYVIKPDKAIISQRELGFDTKSFDMALRSVLRQDPNVVFVGEMRDLETISSALTIAETGHLVFSTLHTNSASQTIDRIIDVFPESDREQIRVQLSNVITAVVSQRLVPTRNGGRIPAFEILIATPAVKNGIREGKTYMIDNMIQTSADVGMVGLESSLAKLVRQGVVAEEVALSYSLRPDELLSNLRSVKIK